MTEVDLVFLFDINSITYPALKAITSVFSDEKESSLHSKLKSSGFTPNYTFIYFPKIEITLNAPAEPKFTQNTKDVVKFLSHLGAFFHIFPEEGGVGNFDDVFNLVPKEWKSQKRCCFLVSDGYPINDQIDFTKVDQSIRLTVLSFNIFLTELINKLNNEMQGEDDKVKVYEHFFSDWNERRPYLFPDTIPDSLFDPFVSKNNFGNQEKEAQNKRDRIEKEDQEKLKEFFENSIFDSISKS